MSNPFTLEFKLKQHTPLIHFQHDQQGATLRASEVKPKLDFFIMKKLLDEKNISYDYHDSRDNNKFIDVREAFKRAAQNNSKWKSWLVGKGNGGHVALDYKIAISAKQVESIPIQIGDRIPLYFGNMGKEYKKKPMSLTTADIVLIGIRSAHNELISEIKAHFPFFLARTNFGTRQDKGYGSFYFHDEDANQYQEIASYLSGISLLQCNAVEWKWVIGLVIGYYYQRLKSGINYCSYNKETRKQFSHYRPSFFRDFFSNLPARQRWEKPWLKKNFFPIATPVNNAVFARALMGMPPVFEFKNRRSQCNPNSRNTAYPSSDITIEVKHNEEEIIRSKSPITFKPVIYQRNSTVFVIPERFNSEPLLNQVFEFNSDNNVFSLTTPAYEIDVAKLISEYNKHLGDSFIAYDFTGKNRIDVTLNTVPNA